MHLMVLLDDNAQVEAHFGPFGDSANLDAQVEARKLFCTHPMQLLGDMGHVKSSLSPFGDGISAGAR
jgi:hypothetical protein